MAVETQPILDTPESRVPVSTPPTIIILDIHHELARRLEPCDTGNNGMDYVRRERRYPPGRILKPELHPPH